MPDPKISVIICTHNRAALLSGALQSVVEQALDPVLFETVVVDNASTDGTSNLVKNFQISHPEHNIVLVHEPKLGLNHARNAGFANARGTYVAYMDDDARAEKEWLEQVVNCFESVSPSPACVGGPILPFYTSLKPDWFQDRYEYRTWGDQAHFLTGGSFSGSNVSFRRDILDQFGGFAVDAGVGMKGEEMFMGDETDLFKRVWTSVDKNARLFYYSPAVVVFHWVPDYKMTVRYRLARHLAHGYYFYLFSHRIRSVRTYIRPFWWTVRTFLQIIWLSIAHRKDFPYYQNWLVECGGRMCYVLGSFGIRPKSLKR
jgi:glycosyltransferase involved in cell wall biosynthesis